MKISKNSHWEFIDGKNRTPECILVMWVPLPSDMWILYRLAALHTSACLLEALLSPGNGFVSAYLNVALHVGYRNSWIFNPLSLPYHLFLHVTLTEKLVSDLLSLPSWVRAIYIWSRPLWYSPIILYAYWYGSTSSKSPMSVLNTFLDTSETPQCISYKSNNPPGPPSMGMS